LIAAKATFALNAGPWLRRERLDMIPPVARQQRRNQAGKTLIGLFRFAQPPLWDDIIASATRPGSWFSSDGSIDNT
jgi:hypothetical protein